MRAVALAIDLGGTELRAALVAEDGSILAFAATQTLAKAGPAAVIGQMVDLADRLRAEAPAVEIIGVGVGAPGPLDPVAGISIGPPTLPSWSNVPLAALLSERFRLPVALENDANAAALGEWRFGAGRGYDSLVFVTVSTGIGGGVIADGRILHGRRGLAAEIGHMTITDRGERCFCGAIGCFEAVASGTTLGHRGEATAGKHSALRRRAGAAPVTGRDVIETARSGDADALALLAEEARLLGIGFTNLLHLFSPDVLIVGGGIANGLDLMRPTIETTIAERAMPAYRTVPVLASALGRHAGIVGAASLVFQGSAAGARKTAQS